MVQDVLVWATAERDSFNPEKGSIKGWLIGMLFTIRSMKVDAYRHDRAMAAPPKPPKYRRKYDWPKGVTAELLSLAASPGERRALEARMKGLWSPYQSVRLSQLRKKLAAATCENGMFVKMKVWIPFS